ncbi:MFS transporter [Vibrio sp. JC009]|uniref:MFS transporter n=1 Tax=Vibrio sp. JC009 TaxID=2912314 RepID=UPI0023B0E07F|nr:MFS transporter [Vibrio sp. JC009]WED22905.1 MFS transporter [Vibrio sp. JC009]
MKKLTHYQRLIISVCLSSVVTFANIYWLQPLLPMIQESFQVSTLDAHLSMSAPLLGMGLGLLVFAPISDAAGRGPVLLTGIALGVCVSVWLPLVEDYSLFLAMRFLQGTFFAVCPAVAVPFFADELRKSWIATAVGFYIAANTLGGLAARLIGGISSEYLGNLHAAGYVIAGISTLLFLVIYYSLPKQRHFKPTPFHIGSCLAGYLSHIRKPKLVMAYMIIGIGFGCFVNLTNYLMTVLESAPYEMPADMRSLMFLTLLGGTTSSSLAGKFAKNHSPLAGIGVGLSIMLAAVMLLSNSHLFVVISGMILLSFGFFFCHANASTLIGKSVRKAKGSAQALYSLFYYSGASLGVLYFEPHFGSSGWEGVLVAAGIALVAAMVLVIVCQIVSYRHKVEPRAI